MTLSTTKSASQAILLFSIISLMTAVALGAFGAHGLESMVTAERLKTWQTAVDYQMSQSIGLLLIGLLQPTTSSAWYIWSRRLLVTGIVIFSGSLYLLVLSDISVLGAITPIGGIALILGWLCLVVQVLKYRY